MKRAYADGYFHLQSMFVEKENLCLESNKVV